MRNVNPSDACCSRRSHSNQQTPVGPLNHVMKSDSDRIIQIFNEALTKPSDEDRARFLDDACRDQPELREQVETLLRAEGPSRDFLKPAEPSTMPVTPLVTEKSGDKIGR